MLNEQYFHFCTNKSITKALYWDFPLACISNEIIIIIYFYFFHSFSIFRSDIKHEHWTLSFCDHYGNGTYRVNNSHSNRDFIDSVTFIKLKSVASNAESLIQMTTNHVIIIMYTKTFNWALSCVAFLVSVKEIIWKCSNENDPKSSAGNWNRNNKSKSDCK